MLKAKQIVKGKFWIVNKDEKQVATIQAIHGSRNVVLVAGGQRKRYPSVKVLKQNHNIIFDNTVVKTEDLSHHVCEFPTDTKPFNHVYDVKQGLPIYTKDVKSKSFYCAGWYLIQYKNNWVKEFCPKALTLSRNPHHGPYKTSAEAKSEISTL